jgi:hypothetical protein
VRVGVKAGQYGWSLAELRGAWAVAEEAGFQVLSCFGHVSAAPNGQAAWDAPTLLDSPRRIFDSGWHMSTTGANGTAVATVSLPRARGRRAAIRSGARRGRARRATRPRSWAPR